MFYVNCRIVIKKYRQMSIWNYKKIINENLLLNIKPASIEVTGREIKQNREVSTISDRKSLFEILFFVSKNIKYIIKHQIFEK